MPQDTDAYHKHVEDIEAGLAPYAKKSFETFSPTFIDGAEIHEHYQEIWANDAGRQKLKNRTPLQLERDRILYSSSLRKQAEKYHVLYSGQRRIARNYTTHAMRMAHVARSISRALGLNADFAEAIALGAKIGAVPFVHAAKAPVADWITNKIQGLDDEASKTDPSSQKSAESSQQQLFDHPDETPLPEWIRRLRSPSIIQKVKQYIPWAAGCKVDSSYSAGQESYWLLCTNPFTREASGKAFVPETMHGIWRHTRGLQPEQHSFHHHCKMPSAAKGYHEINWDQSTYEATVVQYADDITWAIENLNDANDASLLSKRTSLYHELSTHLDENAPEGLVRSLGGGGDSGGLYTYFITDFVRYSLDVLRKLSDGSESRCALREGRSESFIGLSPEGEARLESIIEFLDHRVFSGPRIRNRNAMLRTISTGCLDLLFGNEETTRLLIKDRAALERWKDDELERALSLLQDTVHRVQLAVDIFASMGDQEIYELVGFHV